MPIMSNLKYVVITAARNEADYIENTIQSLTAQTVLPLQWIIVDDGSTDATAEIASRAADKHDWIKVIRRGDRGFRNVGGGNVDAIYDGLENLAEVDYDLLSVVDADLRFGPDYFAVLLGKFKSNPKLGIGAGRVYDLIDGKERKLRSRPEITFGALKCWRRACFQEIGGIGRHPGWDGVDCYAAMMQGWQSWTFDDEERLKITHLRPMGSSQKSIYNGRIRRGRAMYVMGAHPLWVPASAFYHVMEPPYLLGSLCVIYGYAKAWWQGEQRCVDNQMIQFIRSRQMQILKGFGKV